MRDLVNFLATMPMASEWDKARCGECGKQVTKQRAHRRIRLSGPDFLCSSCASTQSTNSSQHILAPERSAHNSQQKESAEHEQLRKERKRKRKHKKGK